MSEYSPYKLQIAIINTEFNSMSDDVKGVHSNPGTAISEAVPPWESKNTMVYRVNSSFLSLAFMEE